MLQTKDEHVSRSWAGNVLQMITKWKKKNVTWLESCKEGLECHRQDCWGQGGSTMSSCKSLGFGARQSSGQILTPPAISCVSRVSDFTSLSLSLQTHTQKNRE